MSRQSLVRVGTRQVGNGQPVFIIAEIGINHNGSLDMARKLIDAALFAGCDAVKFQKRTVELCVPEEQRSVLRDTPWGRMTYIDYRYRLEFGREEYSVIDRYCRERGLCLSQRPDRAAHATGSLHHDYAGVQPDGVFRDGRRARIWR